MTAAGVFWPAPDETYYDLLQLTGTDHRLVWIDVELRTSEAPSASPTSEPSGAVSFGWSRFTCWTMMALFWLSVPGATLLT